MIIAALNPKILKFLCECEKTNLKISVQQVYYNERGQIHEQFGERIIALGAVEPDI